MPKLKEQDRVHVVHDGAIVRGRVQSLDDGMGLVGVSLEDKSVILVNPAEVAPLYRWVKTSKGEIFYPLITVNGHEVPELPDNLEL